MENTVPQRNSIYALLLLALLTVACSNKGATGRLGRQPTSVIDPPTTTQAAPHFNVNLGGSAQLVESGQNASTGYSAAVTLSPLQNKPLTGGGYTIKLNSAGNSR